MLRWLACLVLLSSCSRAWCEGASIDGIPLGGNVHEPSLMSRLKPNVKNSSDGFWSDVPVSFAGFSTIAHIFVNPDGRVQQIELRLPLTSLTKIKMHLIDSYGQPGSDTTSPSVHGLATWDRRDKETAIGLFSEPEHEATLLLGLIWVAQQANHVPIYVH